MKKTLTLIVALILAFVSFAERPPITECWKIYRHKQLETKAEYPGGEDAMYKFIYKNLAYKCGDKGYQGRMMVTFVVDSRGQLWDVKIDNPIAPCLDDEIIKVMYLMPHWIPGTQEGQPVCSEDTINVRIRLGWEGTTY